MGNVLASLRFATGFCVRLALLATIGLIASCGDSEPQLDAKDAGQAQRAQIQRKANHADAPQAAIWRNVTPYMDYPNGEIVIAGWTVSNGNSQDAHDRTVSPDDDATTILSAALQDCKVAGGGTVFVRAGKYKFGDTATLVIPDGCHLRGDWRKPGTADGKGDKVGGTVFYVTANEDSVEETLAFIQIEGSGGVSNINFFYPNQALIGTAVAHTYPPTIATATASDNQTDRRSLNARDLTLVNSYIGINFTYLCKPDPTHECSGVKGTIQLPYAANVYGTPLKRGVRFGDATAFPRMHNINFKPDYWSAGFADRSLHPLTPPTNPKIRNYLVASDNVAIEISGNGAGDVSDSEVDYYKTGVLYDDLVAGGSNGKLFHTTINNATYGVDITATEQDVFIVDSTVKATQLGGVGIRANVGKGTVFIQGRYDNNGVPLTEIHGEAAAIATGDAASGWGAYSINAVRTKITGKTGIFVGSKDVHISVQGSHFQDSENQVKVDVHRNDNEPNAAASFMGVKNTYGTAKSYSLALTPVIVDDDIATSMSFTELPATPSGLNKPNTTNTTGICIVSNGKANVDPDNPPDGVDPDATADIEHCLKEREDSGGTVFIPPGVYLINHELKVPANVELRGAQDMLAYTYIKKNERSPRTGANTVLRLRAWTPSEPKITLAAGSGIRGLMLHNDDMKLNDGDKSFTQFPPVIRINGENCWVYNTIITAAYDGVDAMGGIDPTTGRNVTTTGHYIEGLSGSAVNNLIQISNSTKGTLKNVQANQGFWVRARGLTLDPKLSDNGDALDNSGEFSIFRSGAAVLLADATNETIIGSFFHGPRFAIRAASSGTGASFNMFNTGAEVMTGLRLEKLAGDVNVTNSTWHTIDGPRVDRSNCDDSEDEKKHEPDDIHRCWGGEYINMSPTVSSGRVVSLFSVRNWAVSKKGMILNGGKLHIQQYSTTADKYTFFDVNTAGGELKARAMTFTRESYDARQIPKGNHSLNHIRQSAGSATLQGMRVQGTFEMIGEVTTQYPAY